MVDTRIIGPLAVVLALATPSPAGAYKLEKWLVWDREVLTIYDGTANTGWSRALDRAIRAWNRADVNVRFQKVGSRRKAIVVVTTTRDRRRCNATFLHGIAPVLILGGRPAGANVIFQRSTCESATRDVVAAHELGHVLGLGHETRRCAIMNVGGGFANGVVYQARCGPSRAREVYRRLVMPDDRAGAVARYVRPLPLRQVKVDRLAGEKRSISWTTPNDRRIDKILLALSNNSGCSDPRQVFESDQEIRPMRGRRQTVEVETTVAGRHCVSINPLTRFAQRPRTVTSLRWEVLPNVTLISTNYEPGMVAPATIAFRADAENLQGQDNVRHEWDFGDPGSGASNRPVGTDGFAEHTYSAPGTYTASVTVTDGPSGLKGTGVLAITVASPDI